SVLRDHHVARAYVPMDKTLVVNILQPVRDLGEQVNAPAFQMRVARLDEEVEAHSLDKFDGDKLLALLGNPMFIGLNDVRVPQENANLSLQRPIQTREPGREARGLFLVEQFQADHPSNVPIARPPDFRHAPLPRAPQEIEALADINDRQAALGPWRQQLFDTGEHAHEPLPETAESDSCNLIGW